MAKRNKKVSKKNGAYSAPKGGKNPKGRPNIGIKPGMTLGRTPIMTQQVVKKTAMDRRTQAEGVCSIFDPFCPKAKNSKWPDGQGGGTLAYQIRGHLPFNALSTVTGNLIYFGGSLPFGFLSGSTFAAGNYTMGAGYVAIPGAIGSFSSNAFSYRITSWGVIARNLLPATTAQGYLIISKMTGMPAPASVEAAGLVTGSEVETVELYAGMQTCIIGKPEGTEARKFFPQNISSTQNLGWDVIKIEGVGIGAASTVSFVDFEFVYNVEFTLQETAVALHQFIRPDVPHAPKTVTAATGVLSKVGSIVEGGVESVGKKMLAAAATAVEDIFSDGLQWLAL